LLLWPPFEADCAELLSFETSRMPEGSTGACPARDPTLTEEAEVSQATTRKSNERVYISDAQLEHIASSRGPGSAEAYVLLELREARSAGDHVAAFQTRGRYTVGPAPIIVVNESAAEARWAKGR